MSAPASINSSISPLVMMCSPPSPGTPEACIFPAARISLSFSRADMALRESVIARLLTPLPGLPVSSTMSTPISAARTAFSTVAFLPADIAHRVSSFSEAFCSSTGSRLIPIIRPVSRFNSRTVSSAATFGRPPITGSFTSNILRSRRSAPREAANSAFVTSVSTGMVTPMHSQASTRPSLPAIASR